MNQVLKKVFYFLKKEKNSLVFVNDDIETNLGETALLECIFNKFVNNITWLHNGDEIIYDSDRIRVGFSALILKNLKWEDSGKYTCKIIIDDQIFLSSSLVTIKS